ncbi:hypothetical protein BDZ91DRAFT_722620, partial [Kalaharituber pfeilii]
TADPIFALAIGFASALTRIHREEVLEKGKTIDQVLADVRRRAGIAFGGSGGGGGGGGGSEK